MAAPLEQRAPLQRRATLGTPGTGVGTIYLSKPCVEFPHSDAMEVVNGDIPEPRFETIEAFRKAVAGNKATLNQLNNKVKVCQSCGKPCAYTLKDCNSCGGSLDGVPLTYTDNVFMGFIYGIAKGKFPYKISLRKQSEDFLAFDDPLSLSVCHMNAIPTSVYLADLRFLFTDPVRGCALVQSCFDVAAQAAIEQFWGDDDFRKTFFANKPVPTDTEELKAIAICGMNFPPSMYQLHLQFVHPPMTPFHYSLARNENHFHHGRFFPMEFLLEALSLGERARMEVDENTPMEDILNHLLGLGVSYDAHWGNLQRRCRAVQELFNPWREEDFELVFINNRAYSVPDLMPQPELQFSDMQKADKEALQNYGRPYTDSGKPSGTFYRYAKAPNEVADFVAG